MRGRAPARDYGREEHGEGDEGVPVVGEEVGEGVAVDEERRRGGVGG